VNSNAAVEEKALKKQFETLQTELAGGEPQLQALLQRLHRLDRYAWRMQLLNNQDSMLEHLLKQEQADEDIADEAAHQAHAGQRLTTALADMVDRLEQHVGWVMQAMNRWCLSVLALEAGLLTIVAGAAIVTAAVIGAGQPWPVLQGWWAELLARPVSLTVYSLLLLFSAGLVHFRLRKKMAMSIAARLEQREPFDTERAFLKNTRVWHSIYRPQPVGWAGSAQQQLNEMRKQLTDTVVHSDSEATV